MWSSMQNARGRLCSIVSSAVSDLLNPPGSNAPGLDVLRSLAIFFVVSGHYYGYFLESGGSELSVGRFPLFYYAWTGVDLFFVLSGYLIGRQLWKELRDRGSIDIPRFLLRRGLRIWPFYYAFVLWTVAANDVPVSAYAADVVFLSNYHHHYIGGGWSLSTEEQFYVFMPLLLLAGARLLPLQRAYFLPLALFVALPLVRWVIFSAQPGEITEELRSRLVYMPIHTHSDGLVAGVFLSWAVVMRPAAFAIKLPILKNAVLPLLLIVIGVALRVLNNYVFAYSALALIFTGFALFLLRDESLVTRLCRWRPFYWVSRLSYGMYLNHFPLLAWAVPVILTTLGGPSQLVFWIGYPLSLLLSMFVAALTFIAIESPFLQLREWWLARRLRMKPALSGAGL
jgi:peptidoglycan/LPS O-acetylase OafA/YrhL